MRLLTFNTLYRPDAWLRLRALAPELDGYDVVCLQEVMFRRNARLLRRLAPGLRHHAYAGPVVLKGGLVLLSRWPITRRRFVRYPLTSPARPEYLMRKGAQVVTVATGAGELVVVNTHLSANRDDDWSPGNRWTRVQRAEFERLADRLAGLDATVPLVVAGDLNVPRDSAVLAGFLATAGLRDVLAGDTRPTYRPTPVWPSPPALDHVLVRPSMRAEARLVFAGQVRLGDGRAAYLSDHYGVETELTW
ncbi:endonuclease/exonuclease/phosphatase family protein [Actinoplanes sp. NPDC023801]|uniref:endonuclease/exonuclease/phosphatase family protein n=1 Tax=Actinoplanes sp. NPDC023801 TaxID=3154595 RepID=UPI0033FA2D32